LKEYSKFDFFFSSSPFPFLSPAQGMDDYIKARGWLHQIPWIISGCRKFWTTEEWMERETQSDEKYLHVMAWYMICNYYWQ
jgi:hypothetical protein